MQSSQSSPGCSVLATTAFPTLFGAWSIKLEAVLTGGGCGCWVKRMMEEVIEAGRNKGALAHDSKAGRIEPFDPLAAWDYALWQRITVPPKALRLMHHIDDTISLRIHACRKKRIRYLCARTHSSTRSKSGGILRFGAVHCRLAASAEGPIRIRIDYGDERWHEITLVEMQDRQANILSLRDRVK